MCCFMSSCIIQCTVKLLSIPGKVYEGILVKREKIIQSRINAGALSAPLVKVQYIKCTIGSVQDVWCTIGSAVG